MKLTGEQIKQIIRRVYQHPEQVSVDAEHRIRTAVEAVLSAEIDPVCESLTDAVDSMLGQCPYCNASSGHDDDCPVMKARRLLAWTNDAEEK